MVENDTSEAVRSAIDVEVGDREWEPRPLDNSHCVSQFMEGQLALDDDIIIQGPPGTGKTYMLAQLCDRLCAKGKSVIVMTLTNRALEELATIGLARTLGRKRLFVGDTCQMPPIVEINEDRIARQGYEPYIDGLGTLTRTSSCPSFQLTRTFRLPPRAASFTGVFYKSGLESAAKPSALSHNVGSQLLNLVLAQEGGPSLILLDMPVGDKRHSAAIDVVERIAGELLDSAGTNVAALSYFVDTVKTLQKRLGSTRQSHRLLVDTVSRIQGLTTDVAIYLVPDIGLCYTLEKRLFNVATSRARRHTVIIAPANVFDSRFCQDDVRQYLERLAKDSCVRMGDGDYSRLLNSARLKI